MEIRQFYDEALAHASYAILSEGKVALVDPGRNPKQYLDFADEKGAEIVSVFETHPHADFVSSHKEWIEKYNLDVYINSQAGVSYQHKGIDHNEEVALGKVRIKALYTSGHSPDHNAYLLIDENGIDEVVFTGDSLFVGDVGRPDLREGAGNIKATRKDLAEMMFDTINTVYKELPDEVIVNPAHGPGSLCGKSMSPDRSSTIGKEKENNWAFQINDKAKFVDSFLDGQPFIPHYFPYDVELNRKGANAFDDAVSAVEVLSKGAVIPTDALIIDVRPENDFKRGYQEKAFNIQLGGESSKFETWLGSTIKPDEKFYLVASNEQEMRRAIERSAKIGYETNIIGASYHLPNELKTDEEVVVDDVKNNPEAYNIIDVRNASEYATGAFFPNSKNIPLPELRQRLDEVADDKPILVHCAGGYRSAVASSIIASNTDQTVFDLSDAVQEFK